MNFISEYIASWSRKYQSIIDYATEHMIIATTVILISILITVPLAINMTRMKSDKLRGLIFSIANIFQTITTIVLLAIMIPIFVIGFTPAIVALYLYALLPLLRNTYAGMESVDEEMVEAAKGMGFSPIQQLIKVE